MSTNIGITGVSSVYIKAEASKDFPKVAILEVSGVSYGERFTVNLIGSAEELLAAIRSIKAPDVATEVEGVPV